VLLASRPRHHCGGCKVSTDSLGRRLKRAAKTQARCKGPPTKWPVVAPMPIAGCQRAFPGRPALKADEPAGDVDHPGPGAPPTEARPALGVDASQLPSWGARGCPRRRLEPCGANGIDACEFCRGRRARFAIPPPRDKRSRRRASTVASAEAGSCGRACPTGVQEGFVFGQPDHHLSVQVSRRGELAIWSQGWRRANQLHTYSRPAYLV
jgi:hypothetical protein